MSTIAIAITTYNRPAIFYDSLKRILQHTPLEVPVIVVDDGSDVPVTVPDGVTLHRLDHNQGIAAAKNKCLALLCETQATDFFLFDDDTFPTAYGWWQPYVDSDQPHLMYHFATAPSHWPTFFTGGDSHHRSFDQPRGCMLYVNRNVLAHVGGMHTAFGKHGAEHGDWSSRIHVMGLTRTPYADVREPALTCRDETEAGISSVDYRQHQQWRTVDRTSLPIFAPFLGPVPVLVPRRSDGGWRDELWQLVRNKYWTGFDSFHVVEGEHNDGPFNRAAAVNAAARAAGDWQVAVIADSDSFVPPHSLRAAVIEAMGSGRLVAAFDEVHELSNDQTRKVMHADADVIERCGWPPERIRTEAQDPTTVQSTMLVVPRAVWDAVGGFDEKFAGWGCEDNAFWRACELLTGAPQRIPGPAFHLWHPPAKPLRTDPGWQRNQWRWGLYRDAVCAEQLRALRVTSD